MVLAIQVGLFILMAFVCAASSLNTYSGKRLL